MTPFARSISWKSLPVAVLGIFASSAAGAPRFEGRIDLRVTSQRSGQPAAEANERLYVSPLGARSETTKGPENRARSAAILRLTSKPGAVYRLDPARRTYRVKQQPRDPEISLEQFNVKRLGRARIGRYDCEHVILDGNRGNVVEEWVTLEMKGLDHLTPASSPAKRAHVTGFPVKVILRGTNGLVLTWEVTRVERRAVPADLFDLSGYVEKRDGDE
jgi:hypothetical protein